MLPPMKPVRLEFVGTPDALPPREGLPLYLAPVEAGFPSPAEDYLDKRLDLHEHLVRNRASTFFLRAHGESMIGAGIHDGDLLVVDRSEATGHNKIVITALDGELTVKRLIRRYGRGTLRFAAEGPVQGREKAAWHVRLERRSPRMTTKWEELPKAVCR